MNIYSLLRINRLVKNARVKSAGIWLLHVLRQRYLAVYFDPVLACNLRCRMCYYSKEEMRKEKKGVFQKDDLPLIAKAIFKRALKLQIGCGAEPTLFQHNEEIIRLARQYGVPYISLTTNANLLTEEQIHKLLQAGLDEITLSLHGVEKETYEYLMQNASYEKFLEVTHILSEAKALFPGFKLRVNYTVNERNLPELSRFFEVFGGISIDVLQIRPMDDIGGELYAIEQSEAFAALYKQTLAALKGQCKTLGITCIAPDTLAEEMTSNENSSLVEATYCYVSPNYFWRSDFDWRKETFNQYAARTRYAMNLFRQIFSRKRLSDRKLNYEIN